MTETGYDDVYRVTPDESNTFTRLVKTALTDMDDTVLGYDILCYSNDVQIILSDTAYTARFQNSYEKETMRVMILTSDDADDRRHDTLFLHHGLTKPTEYGRGTGVVGGDPFCGLPPTLGCHFEFLRPVSGVERLSWLEARTSITDLANEKETQHSDMMKVFVAFSSVQSPDCLGYCKGRCLAFRPTTPGGGLLEYPIVLLGGC